MNELEEEEEPSIETIKKFADEKRKAIKKKILNYSKKD